MGRFTLAASTGNPKDPESPINSGDGPFADQFQDRSSERIMDSQLGYSPWFPTLPTGKEFLAAMSEWAERKGSESGSGVDFLFVVRPGALEKSEVIEVWVAGENERKIAERVVFVGKESEELKD